MKLLSSFIAALTILVSVFAAPAAYAEDYDIVFEGTTLTFRNNTFSIMSGSSYLKFKMAPPADGNTYTIGENGVTAGSVSINGTSYTWKSATFTYEGGVITTAGAIPTTYDITGTGVLSANGEDKTIKFTASTLKTVVFSEGGYATFVDANKRLVPEGVTAYRLYTVGDAYRIGIAYIAGDIIPANAPVILKGEGSAKLAKTTGTAYAVDNLLMGATNELTADDMALYNYGMDLFYAFTLDANSTPGSEGFYWMEENGGPFSIPLGKVYLALPKTSGARPSILMSELTTGISTINAEAKQTATYNLQGQRINVAKGLVIRDGKMMLVK